jgi:hypothetical protein
LTTAGPLVGTSGNIPVTASTVVNEGFSFLDTSAVATNSVTPLQYIVTVTQNAATGNGSVAAGVGFLNVTPVTSAS